MKKIDFFTASAEPIGKKLKGNGHEKRAGVPRKT
jgi:hypothetical protein